MLLLSFPYILLILGVAIAVVLFPSIEFRLKIWLKARNDYKTARGTMHARILRKCLSNLWLKIRETENDLEKAVLHERRLINDRKRKLETAATTYLVNLEFTRIPGIGPVLKERVMRLCFDGTLQSLRRAYIVEGIGETKAYAINRWVNQAQVKLPRILRGTFPHKDEINKRYDRLDKEIRQRILDIKNHLQGMRELEEKSSSELAKLQKIRISTFVQSYKGNIEASNAVTNYLLGCFPEWRRVPDWFKILTETYSSD